MIELRTPLRAQSARPAAPTEQEIIDAFHTLYRVRKDETWCNTHWFGHRIFKCPLDTWIYQEILFETKPDVIIETGTLLGGSALFLSNMCDLLGHGRVITIDIDPSDGKPRHPRLTYLQGSSTSDAILARVRELVKPNEKALVVLDSDHTRTHVLHEMQLYSSFVPVGGYLIVEDTNVNGHPWAPEFGPGPFEAVEDFMKTSRDFVIDSSREKFMMTFNPRGYLKRVR